MNSVKDVLEKYNYRIDKLTLNNNIRIIDSPSGKFVVKKRKNKDTRELFRYLNSRGFDNYLDYINDDQDDFMIFPYIDEVHDDSASRANDIILLDSLLHNKTAFYKSISSEEVKAFYEEKTDYIESLTKYYDNIRLVIEEQQFIPPSLYLLIRNISWIFRSLDASKYFLDKWYDEESKKSSRRLCLIHGNLELDHLIGTENRFLISWDNARVDSPIYDLLTFYNNDFFNVPFKTLLALYLKNNPLTSEELYLLFSLMLMPDKLELNKEEVINTKEVYYLIEKLIASNKIISDYHPANSNGENNKHKK